MNFNCDCSFCCSILIVSSPINASNNSCTRNKVLQLRSYLPSFTSHFRNFSTTQQQVLELSRNCTFHMHLSHYHYVKAVPNLLVPISISPDMSFLIFHQVADYYAVSIVPQAPIQSSELCSIILQKHLAEQPEVSIKQVTCEIFNLTFLSFSFRS